MVVTRSMKKLADDIITITVSPLKNINSNPTVSASTPLSSSSTQTSESCFDRIFRRSKTPDVRGASSTLTSSSSSSTQTSESCFGRIFRRSNTPEMRDTSSIPVDVSKMKIDSVENGSQENNLRCENQLVDKIAVADRARTRFLVWLLIVFGLIAFVGVGYSLYRVYLDHTEISVKDRFRCVMVDQDL